MDYILRGETKEVAKVIRENRIRLQRGVISITPVVPETKVEEDEDFGTEDSKDEEITDVKAVNTKTTKRSKKSE